MPYWLPGHSHLGRGARGDSRGTRGQRTRESFQCRYLLRGKCRGHGAQGFLAFLRDAFFLLAPLWSRLGLLLARDNLAFFRGSADCGDLPDTPFSGRSF